MPVIRSFICTAAKTLHLEDSHCDITINKYPTQCKNTPVEVEGTVVQSRSTPRSGLCSQWPPCLQQEGSIYRLWQGFIWYWILKGLTKVMCVCPEGKWIHGIWSVITGNVCICDCQRKEMKRGHHSRWIRLQRTWEKSSLPLFPGGITVL